MLVSVDERDSGRRQDWRCRDAASRFLRRDNGIETMRVTLPSRCRLPKPADDCHSNKYPLRVSAIDENARSLLADAGGVNRRKLYRWRLGKFFRVSSGTVFCRTEVSASQASPLPQKSRAQRCCQLSSVKTVGARRISSHIPLKPSDYCDLGNSHYFVTLCITPLTCVNLTHR